MEDRRIFGGSEDFFGAWEDFRRILVVYVCRWYVVGRYVPEQISRQIRSHAIVPSIQLPPNNLLFPHLHGTLSLVLPTG